MAEEFDPRVTPFRADLAAAFLKGKVEAARYAEPVRKACRIPAAPIVKAPDGEAAMDDQLLFGERFDVYEEKDGWAWGQAAGDAYVGYVRSGHLGEAGAAPDRRITALRTYAFSRPDIKSRPDRLLSLNAKIAVAEEEGRFVRDAEAGWIIAAHAGALDETVSDHAAVAEQFLGAPYLWGGKESLGLDCSGLVQMSLEAAGVAAPRDTDMQEVALGRDVETDEALSGLKRGDLVFWPGHVGIMLDETRLIHANAHHMMTAIEPLREAVDRIGAKGTPLGRIKRV
ncbi:C40 family peptidase [Euryhalocaulis caribicus]|uniref:C40 family peptidase n=1 Tax=Euryhalocaulis caribicus TaxID=1161401 RepID=UPI0003A678E2|nr:C40 family peptidase [Euryhalocaulis caribicus]